MTINKSENLNAQFTVTASDGTVKNVASSYATVDGTNMAVNIGVTISDKTTAADPSNAAGIAQQFSDFITAVRGAAADAGLSMFAIPATTATDSSAATTATTATAPAAATDATATAAPAQS